MNKEEAIEKVKEHGEFYSNSFGGTVNMVPVGPIIDIISQIDEPKKVVIPQFVAEWIEECKRSGRHLRKALYRLVDDMKVGNWAYDENGDLIPEKVDMVARAWLDGYEIEQEKLYTVEIPNPNNKYFMNVLTRMDGKIALVALHKPNTSYLKNKEYQLTESEIKQDFEWAWDAGFAKEVE